jgi:hypothetical protein
MRWMGQIARKGDRRGVYRILVGTPEGKILPGKPEGVWGDKINMDLQEIG